MLCVKITGFVPTALSTTLWTSNFAIFEDVVSRASCSRNVLPTHVRYVFDSPRSVANVKQEAGAAVGLDLMTGEPMLPEQEGVWDNYCVKRQSLHLSTVRVRDLSQDCFTARIE